MLKPLRNVLSQRFAYAMTGVLVFATLLVKPSLPYAQQKPSVHLNPVIAKLAQGKTAYGVITTDLTVTNAREVARAPVDFAHVDQEHNPLDFPALQLFMLGTIDKSLVLKKGNVQPNVAIFASFPPRAHEAYWVVEQALNIGLHGIFYHDVETKQQAEIAVQQMRIPKVKGAKYYEPKGTRSSGPPNAPWVWGLGTDRDEYERHADLWPLNPDGDLLAVLIIESVDGLENVEAIAATPGVGALHVVSANDLTKSLGVRPGAPEVEAARQRVLKACKANKIGCAISVASADDLVKRVKEGWNIIRSTVPVINAGRTTLGDK